MKTLEEERAEARKIYFAKRERIINTFKLKLKEIDWKKCELWMREVNEQNEILLTLISDDRDYCLESYKAITNIYSGHITEDMDAQIGKDGEDTFIYFKVSSGKK